MSLRHAISETLFGPIEYIKDHSMTRVRVYGLVAMLAHLPIWYIWTYLYPQPYENLWLRGFNTLLGGVLVWMSFRFDIESKALRVGYYLILTLETAFVAAWFTLANGSNDWWIASGCVLTLLYLSATDWRLAVAGISVSWLASIILVPVVEGIPFEEAVGGAFTGEGLTIYLFAVLVGTLSHAIDVDVRDVRQRSHLRALGVAAHEFRTPLASIALLVQGLSARLDALQHRNRIDRSSYTDLVDMVADIDRGVHRIQNLVRFHLSNANSEQVFQSTEDVDAASVVGRSVHNFEQTEPGRSGLIKVQAVHTFTTRINQTALEQVLSNLLENAHVALLKATPSPAPGSIRIRLDVHGPWGVIAVSDDGVGIDKADHKRIFQPFVTSNQNHGHGLGLSFVDQVVRSVKGEIDVDSAPGRGATFSVRLPRLQETPE